MKIIDLETDKGNVILDSLKKEGWKKVKEYSWLAFDKGVDYDSYTLKKDTQQLEFRWTNWFEWEIAGSPIAVEGLARKYSLKLQYD